MTARQLVGGVAVAAVLALAACGDDGGSEGGGPSRSTTTEATAEFDAEGGKVKVSDGEGGSFEVDDDGMTVTDGEGGGETQVLTGEDAAVPEGWPEGLRPPAGAKLLSATTSTTPGDELLALAAELEAPVADALAAFERQVVAAGYEINPSGTSGGAAGVATLIASDDDELVVASFSSGPGGTTIASISITPSG